MEIINPPRQRSLGPQLFTIMSHVNETTIVSLNPEDFKHIYPFETLFSLKQRIAVLLPNTPPNQLFVALEKAPNRYEPLEFSWPFLNPEEGLPNPQDPTIAEQPDPRLYENAAKKPVFPTIYSAVTLDGLRARGLIAPYVVHVWTLASILPSATRKQVTEPVFEGFVRMYFPYFTTMPLLGKQDKEAAKTLSEFRGMVDRRYTKLDAGLKLRAVYEARKPILTELYIFKCTLPQIPDTKAGQLELMFYETKPTPTKPFLRFFPAKDRSPALVKVATNEDRVMVIRNERQLDMFMAEKPITTNGAVMLIKVPIDHPKAPLGTCWTLRIYENGAAELYIGAPRRDAPLLSAVVFQAMRMVPQVLADTPWAFAHTKNEIHLCELTAEYELLSSLEIGKPGKNEFANRLDPFVPLFSVDPPVDNEKATIALRYKGVSNYVQTSNPIMNYLTALYLNRNAKTTADVPKGTYVDALRKEFGISLLEAKAAEEEWIERHSRYVATYKTDMGGELRVKELSIRESRCGPEKYQSDEDTTISAYNVGASITIFNEHPKYRMLIAGAESVADLSRMLSLMGLYINQSAEDLKVAKTSVDEVKAVVEDEEMAAPPPVVPEELAAGWDQLMMGMMEEFPGEIAEEELGPEEALPAHPTAPESGDAAAATRAALDAAVAMPTHIAPDERLPPISKEWYLNNLKRQDRNLFQYTKTADARVKLYSRQCQLSQHRQPNVLGPEAYKRAKILYGDSVIWLEAPPTKEVQTALSLASKTSGQRKGLPKQQIVEMEILALSKGFPLKDNKSVSDDDPKISKEQKERLQKMRLQQEGKPLWVVVKTGTDSEHINYYLCSEYWCIRDDLPLIGKVFKGTTAHDGSSKEANSCPFCRGRLITNKDRPEIGETVVEREVASQADKVAHYSGFLKDLAHPEFFGLPCCFTDPKHLEPPPGAKIPETAEADAEATAPEDPIPAVAPAPTLSDMENRDRPFSPVSKLTSAQNRWYIPNQNVLGRIKQDWFDIEKGAIAVPPASVNKFLGQNPEEFLTKNKGVGAEKINSYLTSPAKAFIRYGLGHKVTGNTILSLIAWAKYAVEELKGHSDDLRIYSDEYVREMFNNRLYEVRMARAFEQANYGSLLHEFATTKTGTTGQVQEWCTLMGISDPSSAYAQNFFSAWMRFKMYVNDPKTPKDLRLWEMLFATPGLFTSTGCILVRIQVPKNKTDSPTLFCPQFGISYHDQAQPPPFLFLVEDVASGNYDPLVFYEGRSNKQISLFGVIQPDAVEMSALSPQIQAALRTFTENYVSGSEGCGRSVAPTHPWIPVRDATLVPRLTDLASILPLSDPSVKLLRDRSNRLVGVIVPSGASKIYYPVVDDGLILPDTGSVYGEEALPKPDIKLLFEAYLLNTEGCTKDNAKHPGLLPVSLRNNGQSYTAVEVSCGAVIPILPFPIKKAKTKPIVSPCFADMLNRPSLFLNPEDAPWSADLMLLQPTTSQNSLDLATKEEELEEAYQSLRISFSAWLITEEGKETLRAIEMLRQARRRLPMWELQKRLDLLLYPIIRQWVSRNDNYAPMRLSILRKDCLQIQTEGQCTQGCAWQGPDATRRCLIHTTQTQRYADPVRLMAARLTDELLRTFGKAMEILHQDVSRLKPLAPNELLYEPTSLLFSAVGRGSKSLYETLGYSERQPTLYTAGLTYPEEVGIDGATIQLPEDWRLALRRIPYNAVLREPSVVLQGIIHSLTGKEEHFQGTAKDWLQLARTLNVNIIKTHYDSEKHRIDVYEVLEVWKGKPDDMRNYMVLDVDGLPLESVKTRNVIIPEADLPASIRNWE